MWAGMAARRPGSTGELAALFQSRLEDPATLPFAVTDGRTGALLGTTSLRDYVPDQQRLEIGGTFYGRQFWGSHVNPASKHMLLAYAYEVLEVDRVAFRCDARNTRSATAIERLGAQFEGVLRGHRAAPGGGRADTAVFSILSQEWPHVREDLRRRLAPFAVGADYSLGSSAATWNP
jgi:RimJ/RimL family protein N-acetyltransferase